MHEKSFSLNQLDDYSVQNDGHNIPLPAGLHKSADRPATYLFSSVVHRTMSENSILDTIRHAGDNSNTKKNKMAGVSGALDASGPRTVHQAARNGDVDVLKMILMSAEGKSHHKINELNGDWLSPLHYAARYNHLPMVKYLLERGANVNIRGEEGLTPLHLAARHKKVRNPKIANIKKQYNIKNFTSLPAYGIAECSSTGSLFDSGISIWPVLPSPDSVVLCLVAHQAEVNVKDNFGLTALHYAAMRGNEVAAKDLLQCRGINIEARDAENMTPLHLAVVHGNSDIVELLISAGANLSCCDENMVTPLHRAAREGYNVIVWLLVEAAERRGGVTDRHKLISEVDNEQTTPLHLAVENGHCDIVKYLITKGADPNKPRQNFVCPLHLAATAGDVQILDILLGSGEKINCVNVHQETPLHRAAEFNHCKVIEHLIKRGANIEARNKDNFTPLLLAASHGHVEAIECLMKHGADVFAVDKDDKTAIYWASQQNKHDALAVLLKDPHALFMIDRTDRYGNSPLHVSAMKGYLGVVQRLVEEGAQIDLKNEEEQMPLHLAAKYGRTKIVRELIRKNRQIVNGEDEDGNTPLHLAAVEGHESVVKVLLDVGANVEARNSHLWTPLDSAASRGWIQAAKVLLEANCPIDPLDRTKTTPLHLAACYGSVEVCMLLLEWGADIKCLDDHGRNCLELAIEHMQKDVAMAIIQSSYWMDALRNENVDARGIKNTPLRMLIRKMPEVAEAVCNRCTRSNSLPSDHPLYTATFNYELLEDSDCQAKKMNLATKKVCGNSKKCPLWLGGASLHSQYGNVFKENHPLMIMVRSRRQKLLGHPLCISLIHLKWICFGRYVYYCNLLLYLLFVTFLTSFLLTTPTPTDENTPVKGTHVLPSEAQVTLDAIIKHGLNCSNILRNGVLLETRLITRFAKFVVIILSILHLVREFFQMYMLRINYLCLENLMEWTCYVSSLLVVLDFSECSAITELRHTWQWQLGSISIFLGWMNLVLFIRKLPYLGIYVVMFTDVLSTFCKVCVVFFFFLVAFGLGFYVVMYYEDPFATAGKSIVRSMVMMLGELEFDDLFIEEQLRYPIPTYVFLIAFIVLISLITMNLLVGLAVDDIKTVQEQANLKRLAMQVELVLNVESVMPSFLKERFYVEERSFMPNRMNLSLFGRFLSHFNTTQTVSEALLARDRTEIEKIQENQDQLAERLATLLQETKKILRQNQQLQNMMTLLARHQGVRLEDDDKGCHSNPIFEYDKIQQWNFSE